MPRVDDGVRRTRRQFPGNPHDDLGRHIGMLLCPRRRGLAHCLRQLIESLGITLDEGRIVKTFGDHHVAHRQEYRQIAAGTNGVPLVGLAGEHRHAGIEADHLRPLLLRRHHLMRIGDFDPLIKVMAKGHHITGMSDIHHQIAPHHHLRGDGLTRRAG